MKPIRICIVSLYAYQYFNPSSKSRGGGAELQLYYFATELAKDDNFSVNFFVGDFGQEKNRESIEGVTVIKTVPIRRRFKFISGILLLTRLIPNLYLVDADVYVQRAAGIETGIVALFCKIFRKKFIYMVAHDEDVINKKPNWMRAGFGHWIRWKLFIMGLKMADVVVVQHERQKENLKKYFNKESVMRQSAHVVPYHFDLKKENYILWDARCESWKQPELLIKLAEELPLYKFVMIAPFSGNQAYLDTIRSEAKKLNNIEFIDRLPSNEFDNYFMRAKLHINTSKTEGFPNTFIQALKNKTPIVSLNINPNGMLEKYDIGRCANGDLDMLKKDLVEIMGNEDLWSALSENGYQYVLENHDIKKVIEGDKKMIQELLK